MDKQLIHKLSHRIDKRPLSERLVLLFILSISVYLVMNILLISPQQEKNDSLMLEMKKVKTNITLIENQFASLRSMVKINDKEQLTIKRDSLKEEVSFLYNDINLDIAELVPPEEMIEILKNVVKQTPGVKITYLKLLTPESIKEPHENTPHVNEGNALYKNPIEVNFTADYLSTFHYLDNLAELKIEFIWDSIEYDVTKYPKAEIKMKLIVLSKAKGFINA